ncbi:hypothetical protein, partial [Roseovarius sp.]|uniref:hypothetical protein n=1 Tax=Roseovarius sp. TaxID=1486281 RepID=UPI0035696D99
LRCDRAKQIRVSPPSSRLQQPPFNSSERQQALGKHLELSQIETEEQKILKIEKALRTSILRASQTDFQFSRNKRSLEPVPFPDDLALFDRAKESDLRDLVSSLARTSKELIPSVQNSNINSVALTNHLEGYSNECQEIRPNPRYLQHKGEIIRRALASNDILNALNDWDKIGLERFVEDHNELMRRYFGEALQKAREVEIAEISPSVADDAADLLADAIKSMHELNRHEEAQAGRIDDKSIAVFFDLKTEIDEILAARERANSPDAIERQNKRALVVAKHSAVLTGRLIFRSFGAVISNGGNLGGLAFVYETASPGSLRAVYEVFERAIPALPSLPF